MKSALLLKKQKVCPVTIKLDKGKYLMLGYMSSPDKYLGASNAQHTGINRL